ncbi:TPA: glycosyltransferase family 2 protein [Streptococcus suis]
MSDMDISIVIPTYNRELFLKEALESIFCQKNVRIEIIVIDDCSTDNTETLINEISKRAPSNICMVYQKNESKQFAHISRFRGLEIATGDIIVFMDDDDFYIDDSVFELVKDIFERNKSIGAFIASTAKFLNGEFLQGIDLNSDGIVARDEYVQHFGFKYPKPLSTLSSFFRTDLLRNSGINKFKMVNDTCIYLNGILLGDVFVHNKAIAAYRVHETNISKSRLPLSFIIQTLEEKKRLYKKVKLEGIINNPAIWYFNNLRNSIYYFLESSNFDVFIIVSQSIWLLFKGNGVRLLFFRDFLQRAFCRRK